MCGINGFISEKHKKKDLQLMMDSLHHRGPNAEGFFFDPNTSVGLGHRRLSILDLSTEANQPTISHCGRYVMVYNGEVYNYKEIAKTLKIIPKTSSDSEIVLEAFAKKGSDFVSLLNGMFSIAIYDKQEHIAFLFRDRLGIKPLYYYHNQEDLVFASEIKAIKQILPQLSINKSTINQFLYLGYAPKESTIYENVYKLQPGCYATFTNKTLSIQKYWSIHDKIEREPHSGDAAKKQLKELLYSAIDYRMISDVPLGTFLSGGTDSSTVTAIASKISNQKLDTFSIGFHENKFNESDHAKKIAKHLGTNHHEFMVSHKDALDNLEMVMQNFDEPFVDSSALPTYLVSKLTKKHASVALSGDGGDELFLGYGAYNWANRMNNPLIWNSRSLLSFALNITKNNRAKRAALLLNCPNKNQLKSHIFSQEQYLFSQNEIKELVVSNKWSNNIFQEAFPPSSRKLLAAEQQAIFDLENYLPNDLLTKVDRTSMLNSLEVRVPLLDHRIVEKAVNIHHSLKMHGSTQKLILKEILYELVPRNLLDHPKWGFSIPLGKWLKKELAHLLEQYLNDQLIQRYNLVDLEQVQLLKKRFKYGEDYLYNRIWQLIVLHKFFVDSSL